MNAKGHLRVPFLFPLSACEQPIGLPEALPAAAQSHGPVLATTLTMVSMRAQRSSQTPRLLGVGPRPAYRLQSLARSPCPALIVDSGRMQSIIGQQCWIVCGFAGQIGDIEIVRAGGFG